MRVYKRPSIKKEYIETKVMQTNAIEIYSLNITVKHNGICEISPRFVQLTKSSTT